MADLLDRAPALSRTDVTRLDSAAMLARCGLAPRLVCRWALTADGRLFATWEERVVPRRPIIARPPILSGS